MELREWIWQMWLNLPERSHYLRQSRFSSENRNLKNIHGGAFSFLSTSIGPAHTEIHNKVKYEAFKTGRTRNKLSYYTYSKSVLEKWNMTTLCIKKWNHLRSGQYHRTLVFRCQAVRGAAAMDHFLACLLTFGFRMLAFKQFPMEEKTEWTNLRKINMSKQSEIVCLSVMALLPLI